MRIEIGPGRFGPIYRAADPRGGDVAIKVFDQGLTHEQARLLAEALGRLCHAPLDHPSIVSPVSAGSRGELAWVAEPWIDAAPLDATLAARGALPVPEALLRITQLGGALDFAAAAGVYHGALHPRDILITPDRALLTGFGFVQALSEAGFDVPMSGAAASPQRALGLPATHADDVYTLAAMAIEMLYGRALSDRRKVAAVVGPLPGIDHARLRDVLEGSLAEDPGDRPSTALEFAGAVQQAVASRPISIPPPPAAPIAPPDVAEDLPLRPAEPAPDPVLRVPATTASDRHSELAVIPARELEFAHLNPVPPVQDWNPKQSPDLNWRSSAPTPDSESRSPSPISASYFGIAIGLAIGILAGFAGGFVVGQRDATPTPLSASRAVPRAQRQAAPSGESPAATSGREFTESAVPSTPVEESEVRPAEPSAPARVMPAPPQSTDRAPEQDPGRVEVISRPAGAQVFVDGRLVGRTPLLLSQVAPGAHAIRLALPGHQRWVTTVDVSPGSHARVAASLER